ncbi:MAG: hypothetical protein Kow0080_14720 [Candidatus Promineifilaceae bacterium]
MEALTVPKKAPAHLLVVDDEIEIAESLADFLRNREGYTIQIASNGQQAIDYLQSTLYQPIEVDLVVLDMRMPGVSGLEVLEWIRAHPDLKYTRVVLLTAASGSHEKVQALSAGADDYITKPYYPRELLARVKTILRTQQLEKRLQKQSQQLAALNRVGQAVSSTLETQAVLETAVSGICTVAVADAAAIVMQEGNKLRFRLWQQNGSPLVHDLHTVEMDQGLVSVVFQEQTAVSLHNTQTDERFKPGLDAPLKYKVTAMMAAPLIVKGRSVGVLCAYNPTDDEFSEVDLDLFVSLTRSVSEAIENAWLFQRVRLRQQELLESRNTLQALIDGIPDPIYTINDNWELVSVNKSKTDEQETAVENLIGRVCYKAFYNRSTPCQECLVAQTLSRKTAHRWSVRWFGDDHLPRDWNVSAYPIPTAQASAARAVIVWQDRTEEKRLEASLLQAGKLAAIGQLAAGVAHEINNPLTAINANAEMLKMFIPQEDENYEAVDLIHQAGERAAKVVRGLLDFARQEQYNFVRGDVNRSIQQALDLVRYQLQSSQVNVQQQLNPNLPEITASWEHLKSVWLNLLVNARDATLTLAENRQIEITTRYNKDEGVILVLFKDNGKGMSEAELAHIFEPFYTTKDPGKGTGLGLATSHRIIEQHKGEIHVVSAPQQGTTFVIRLPVHAN